MACVVTEVEPALLWILTRDDSSDTLCHSEHSHFLQSTSSERGEHLAKQILGLYEIYTTSGAFVLHERLSSKAYNVDEARVRRRRRKAPIVVPEVMPPSVRQTCKLAVRIFKSRSSANTSQLRRGCCSSSSISDRRWVPSIIVSPLRVGV
jgi:hypothetical protein